jgi:hypothetical protein
MQHFPFLLSYGTLLDEHHSEISSEDVTNVKPSWKFSISYDKLQTVQPCASNAYPEASQATQD